MAGASCERRDAQREPQPAAQAGPRLAVLSPAVAILIERLGGAHLIVGRHGFDLTLDAAVPVVGDQSGLNYEALLALEPSDVVIEKSAAGAPPRLAELARGNGWRVTEVGALTLDDVRRMVRTVDPLLRNSEPAGDLSERAHELLREMDRAWSRRPGLGERAGRTAVLLGLDPPWAMGPGCFHTEMLAALGIDTVPRSGSPSIMLSLEGLMSLDPDSLIVLSPGLDEAGEAGLRERVREIGLRAAREGRVLIVRDRLCLTPSPAMIELADEIARGVSAWPAR